MLFSQQILAQNERFHGGRGDGADTYTSDYINFNTVDYEGDVFSGHIDRAVGQTDTTENKTINFKLSFSEPVIDLVPSSIELSGDAQPQTVTISGSGTDFNIAVSGMLSNGSVIINLPEGAVHNSVGAPNLPAVVIDNEVVFLGADFTVEITRAPGQNYLTKEDTVHFSVGFNEHAVAFDSSVIELSGSASPTNMSVTGSGKTYDLAVSGYQPDGTVAVNIPANSVLSILGKPNEASINTGNTVVIDKEQPEVEIKLDEGQQNPAYVFPIKFKVVFSEEVVDFSKESITYGGSPGLKIVVSGNGSVYTVSLDSAVTNETVSIYIAENTVHDFAGNGNTTASYTENSVTYKGITGINDLSLADFAKIYAQNGNLMILFHKLPEQKVFVEVFQLNGQRIISKRLQGMINAIELRPYNAYIIKLSGKGFVFSKQIFVQ